MTTARASPPRNNSSNGRDAKRARTEDWRGTVDSTADVAANATREVDQSVDRMPRSDTRHPVTILDAPTPSSTARVRVFKALRAVRQAFIPSSMADESSSTAGHTTSTSSRRPGLRKTLRWPTRTPAETAAEKATAVTVNFEEDVGKVDIVVVDSPFEMLKPPDSVVAADAVTQDGRMSHQNGGSQHEHGSRSHVPSHSIVESSSAVLRERIMPFWQWIHHFFDSSFADPEKELAYRKEEWHTRKPVAIVCAIFYLAIWATLLGFFPHPIIPYEIGADAVGMGVLSVSLVVLVAIDCPLRAPFIWQLVLGATSFWLPFAIHIELWECGFVSTVNTCGAGRNFISSQFYANVPPMIALLCFHQHRAFAIVGGVAWASFVGAVVISQNTNFSRNIINFVLLMAVLIWVSFLAEKAQRRIFTLRDQLKTQFKATQRAQASERVASEAKRRFLAYIFHEIRGPTNAAMLALANLEGEAVFDGLGPAESEMVQGITSSLVMMERVLNSVLDHSRMESGKFVLQQAPFDFANVFRMLLLSHRGAATAKAIELDLKFDPKISQFSTLYIGDETRIYQCLSNFVSNAIKFTPPNAGKSITISTKLLHPTSLESGRRPSAISLANEKPVPLIDAADEQKQLDTAVIRMEVSDMGVGIRPRDFHEGLFVPYAQTAVGLRQGGKGSGLGLALVKQIVRQAGGRLGVESQIGSGSTFWIELPLRRPHVDTPRDEVDADLIKSLSGLPKAEQVQATRQRRDLDVSQFEARQTASGLDLYNLPPLTPSDEGSGEPTALEILVADDDKLTRKLMARMLERLGHNVSSAEDGGQALEMVRQGWTRGESSRYDLIFLDNQMPVLSGVDVVREMRRIGLATYTCGVSGNALLEDQEAYIEAGLDRLLTKPILERNVRDVIDAARAHRRVERPPPPAQRMQSFGAVSSQIHGSVESAQNHSL